MDSTIPIIVRETTAVPKIANYLTENNIEFDVESLSLSEDFDIKWFINYDKNRELVQKTLPLTVEHIIKDEYYPIDLSIILDNLLELYSNVVSSFDLKEDTIESDYVKVHKVILANTMASDIVE